MSAVSAIDWLLAPLSKMEPKDVATLTVSCVALFISLMSVLHAITSKRRESKGAAQSAFVTVIEAMVLLRQEREDSQRWLGDDWSKSKSATLRTILNDRRDLLISRAVALITKYELNVSEIEYIILGSAITDVGRRGEALPYFARSVEVASTPLTRAWSRRPYGRALMLNGDVERGRNEMLAAAKELSILISAPGLDADAMRTDRADVFRRLLITELHMHVWTDLRVDPGLIKEDLAQLVALTAEIRNVERRKAMEDAISELEADLRKAGLLDAIQVKARPST